jgi:uracil-DNA glycosylase family 4
MKPSLKSVQRDIVACTACPRLRKYCQSIAKIKRRAYATEDYWGKPITGFGDSAASLVIVGLAPAAHGANRTGRIFTGDRSGQWLFRALHKAGFANQPTYERADDGLKLEGAYVTCVVKCAPPGNKPLPKEIERCGRHLVAELDALPTPKVWLVLGQIALNGLWPHLRSRYGIQSSKPKFSHEGEAALPGGMTLLMSYHPSQQNTFTGRLTEPMFDQVFRTARKKCYPRET